MIASRPELAISQAFQQETRLHGMFTTLSLDDSADARADIRQFVIDSFGDIIDTHPMRKYIPLPWPNSRSIDDLVRKSSGHFIYAATTMKFIASRDEHPYRALQVIEGLQTSRTRTPFAELDSLYHHILTSAKYAKQAIAILRQCFLIDFNRPFTHSSRREFEDEYSAKLLRGCPVSTVSLLQDISPPDVDLFLSDVQALVSVSLDGDSKDLVVRPKHLSLQDFIEDEERSQDLYIARGAYHASLLPRLFHLFGDAKAAQISVSSSAEYRHRSQREIPTNGGNAFILAMCEGIKHCHDGELLNALIRQRSLQDIWFFYQCPLVPPDQNLHNEPPDWRATIRSFSVAEYMTAIRDCVSNQFPAINTTGSADE